MYKPIVSHLDSAFNEEMENCGLQLCNRSEVVSRYYLCVGLIIFIISKSSLSVLNIACCWDFPDLINVIKNEQPQLDNVLESTASI